MSRQLALFAPASADEDADQLDLIETAGTEPSRPLRSRLDPEAPHRFMPAVLDGRRCWLCDAGTSARIHRV